MTRESVGAAIAWASRGAAFGIWDEKTESELTCRALAGNGHEASVAMGYRWHSRGPTRGHPSHRANSMGPGARSRMLGRDGLGDGRRI